jgi:glycosyltransferase involved in cell wall biosynthesis
MRSTHISVIHRAWDTRIFYKECRALADAGYETHLLIGGPANPDPVDGVHVHSLSDDPGRPPARRQWRRLTRAMRLALALRPSIYHLHDPHLIPLGVVLKALGAHVVYDRHEDFPAHARSKLPGRPVRAWLKASMWVALEWIAARTFDGFVCASPDLVRPLPAGSTIVVNNYPLRRLFAEEPAPPAERDATIVYAGSITAIRGFNELIQAVELLPLDLEWRLELIGAFRPASLVDRVSASPVADRIDVLPWQPYPLMLERLARARAGVILLHPVPNHDDPTRSNKLYEYMAAGLPVVASTMPRWQEIVEGVGCGLAVDPREPAAIAAALERLLTDSGEAGAMGRRGRQAFLTTFNWDAEAARLLSLYERFAPPRTRQPAAAAPSARRHSPGPRPDPLRPSGRDVPAGSRGRTAPLPERRESAR